MSMASKDRAGWLREENEGEDTSDKKTEWKKVLNRWALSTSEVADSPPKVTVFGRAFDLRRPWMYLKMALSLEKANLSTKAASKRDLAVVISS